MAIPVEVFSSARGVFVAAPAECELFGAERLVLDSTTRVLRGISASGSEVSVGRLPEDAVGALRGVSQVPLVAFELGGVCEAAMLPLAVNG